MNKIRSRHRSINKSNQTEQDLVLVKLKTVAAFILSDIMLTRLKMWPELIADVCCCNSAVWSWIYVKGQIYTEWPTLHRTSVLLASMGSSMIKTIHEIIRLPLNPELIKLQKKMCLVNATFIYFTTVFPGFDSCYYTVMCLGLERCRYLKLFCQGYRKIWVLVKLE